MLYVYRERESSQRMRHLRNHPFFLDQFEKYVQYVNMLFMFMINRMIHRGLKQSCQGLFGDLFLAARRFSFTRFQWGRRHITPPGLGG